MAIGLDADTEYARRSSIPSGGAGTLSGGGFSDFFAGVWLYRPSSTATYALTAGSSIIDGQGGARLIALGFNSAGSALADLNLQVTFNSGGGTGAVQTFSGHTGASFLDEWVYYFFYENSSNNQVAGYILLSDLTTATTISRANDNAGSQYVNTLTFGNVDGGGAVVLGHYAYARAVNSSSLTASNVLTYAGSSVTESGDWGFWPLADNADTGDDSGNGRSLTFSSGLTSESDPNLSTGVTGTLAKTLLNDTLSAAGTTTVVGTLAKTNVNDTSAASGSPIVNGSLAITNQNDTASVSGSVGSPVSGTVAVTNVNDTLSAAGTTTVTGSVAKTNTNDTSSAQGSTTVVGSLATTNGNDTLSASGSVGSAVAGTLAVTNQNDTLASQGSTTVTGLFSYTNINDSIVASGTTTITGTVAKTNNNDTLNATGFPGNPVVGQGTRLPLTGAGAS